MAGALAAGQHQCAGGAAVVVALVVAVAWLLSLRSKDKTLAQQALAQLMAATEAAKQAPNGSAVATDLQKRLGAAGATAAKLIAG